MATAALDVSRLEQWLWDAACEIRGPLDAPKFKDYILPLVFLKRLDDVFADEVTAMASGFGGEAAARQLVEADHDLVRFYIPEIARWSTIATKTAGLGEHLTYAVRAVARENPRLQGVIDVQDFNTTSQGQRIVDDSRLTRLVQVLGRHDLGLDEVEPDILGRLKDGNGEKVASSGEAFDSRSNAKRAAENVKKTAPDADITDRRNSRSAADRSPTGPSPREGRRGTSSSVTI